MKQYMSGQIKNILKALFVILFISCLFVNVLYLSFFFPLILLLIIRTIKNPEVVHISSPDVVIILLCVVEIVGLHNTNYIPNTIKTSCVVVGGATLWIVLRLYMKDLAVINLVLSVISILVGFLAAITVWNYYKHKMQFMEVEIFDMTVVKQYLRPFGMALNDWVAVLICFLPFPLYMALRNKNKLLLFLLHMVSFVCVNMAIYVSFSRSGYFSLLLFVFFIALLFFLYDRKKVAFAVLVAIIGISFSLVTLINEKVSVLKTSSMSGTISQQRSTEGRTKKWKEAISLFKQTPLRGAGGGNYELSSRLYGLKNYNSLSYRSTNTALQVLVEKGLIGISIYVLAFILVYYSCYKSVRSNCLVIPFISTIVALLFREMFFNTFFDNKVFTLFVIIFYLSSLLIIQDEK